MPLPNYPLDLTSVAPSNHIQGEVHAFSPSIKAIVPNAGSFYTRNLVVRREVDNVLMQPHIDYKALEFVRAATEESGYEVCLVIQNLSPDFNGNIVLDYHAVGGEYIALLENATALIAELDANRVYRWGDIIDLPVDFPPRDHMQHLNTLYGANDLIIGLANIERAIMSGDVWAFQQVYAYVDNILQNYAEMGDITTLSNNISSALNAHFNNNGAHTPAQVGLSNLANWAIGTVQEHMSGTASRYASTAGVKAVYDALVLVLNGKARNTFEIQTTGVLTGGGSLGQAGNTNLQLKVEAADNTAALAGLNTGLVITPPGLKHVLDTRFGTMPMEFYRLGSLAQIWNHVGTGVYEYDRPVGMSAMGFVIAEIVGGGSAGGYFTGNFDPVATSHWAFCSRGGKAGGYGKVKFTWPTRYTKMRMIVGIGGKVTGTAATPVFVGETNTVIQLFDSTTLSWVVVCGTLPQGGGNGSGDSIPVTNMIPTLHYHSGPSTFSKIGIYPVEGVDIQIIDGDVTYGEGHGITGDIILHRDGQAPHNFYFHLPLGENSRWPYCEKRTYVEGGGTVNTNERYGVYRYIANDGLIRTHTTSFGTGGGPIVNFRVNAQTFAQPGHGGGGGIYLFGNTLVNPISLTVNGTSGNDGAGRIEVYR